MRVERAGHTGVALRSRLSSGTESPSQACKSLLEVGVPMTQLLVGDPVVVRCGSCTCVDAMSVIMRQL